MIYLFLLDMEYCSLQIICILIFFLSFIKADTSEPFYNYKIDKSYTIINPGLIPVIDGRLEDDCWDNIKEMTSFVQSDPNYNYPPTEDLNVKIFQDEYAIYIGARLFDDNPELITQKFVNRDDFINLSKSDYFSISIDSHHDHQTGYEFIVNAAGVQFDSFLFDDTEWEMNWDGVWESMVSIDDEGWIVEMRIPFSSLRFSKIKNDESSEWGMNIKRYIHRKNEDIEWIILPKGTASEVSKFGHITNIKDIENETVIEFIPHISDFQVVFKDKDGNELVPVCYDCGPVEKAQGSSTKVGSYNLGEANMQKVHTAEVYLTIRSSKEIYKNNKSTKIKNHSGSNGNTQTFNDKYHRETFFVSVHTRNLSKTR